MVEFDQIDKPQILEAIRKHFDEITPQQFEENLKRTAPFLWDATILTPDDFCRAVKRTDKGLDKEKGS
jgi:hypothetical protein